MKKKLLALAVVLILSGRAWFYLTDGFTIQNISSELFENSEWAVDHSDYSPLNQSYTYLAKGCQSYAFLSDDGKYVLKFFKQKHLRPSFLESWSQTKWEKKIQFKNQLYKGCKLAFDQLQEECGLVAMHLTNSQVPVSTLTLKDKTGRPNTINPSEFAFYIQRYGEPIRPKLAQMERDEIEKLLNEIVSLAKLRHEKGVKDRDPALFQNIALIDNRPIFIDIGQFELSDESIFNGDSLLQDLFSAVDRDIVNQSKR